MDESAKDAESVMCLGNGKLPALVQGYHEILRGAGEEIVDLRFSLPHEQRAVIKEFEAKTRSDTHRDFVLKCIELLRRKPELIVEMRGIPVPSLPQDNSKITRMGVGKP